MGRNGFFLSRLLRIDPGICQPGFHKYYFLLTNESKQMGGGRGTLESNLIQVLRKLISKGTLVVAQLQTAIYVWEADMDQN